MAITRYISYSLRVHGQDDLAPLLLLLEVTRGDAPAQWQGIVHALPCNRIGSCWLIHEMSFLLSQEQVPTELHRQFVRDAINAKPGSHWLTRVDSLDHHQFAVFQGEGFQPILTQGIWEWEAAAADIATADSAAGLSCPQGYAFRSFQPDDDTQRLLSLDRATTPVMLRNLLDRREQDLRDETVAGLLLEDCHHQQLAAAIRLVQHPPCIWRQPPQPQCRIEVAVHPDHEHLYSGGTLKAGLLHLLNQSPRRWQRLAASGIGLRCNQGQIAQQQWLQDLGAHNTGGMNGSWPAAPGASVVASPSPPPLISASRAPGRSRQTKHRPSRALPAGHRPGVIVMGSRRDSHTSRRGSDGQVVMKDP